MKTETLNFERETTMNIVHVEIENLLGLTEATIEPGHITYLSGGNGAGKSATIESIVAAFNSKGIAGEIVTQGADRGRVLVRLDDGTTIKRQFKPDGTSTVQVKTAAGDTKSSPQSWLDGLLGAQIVNPVQFLQMSTAEKRRVLLSALPITVTAEQVQEWFGEALPVDTGAHGLEVLAQAEKLLYGRRRDANAEVKAAESQLAVVSQDIPSDFNTEEWDGFDVSEAQNAIESAGALAEQKRALAEKAYSKQLSADSSAEKVVELRARADELQKQADDAREDAARLTGESEAITVPDTAAIKSRLAQYTTAQRIMQQVANAKRLSVEVAEKKASAERLSALVEVARQKPGELMAAAEFPVEGLTFTDTDILVNGLSLDSLSDGEKLQLGICIARVGTGPLGFIVIDGAELLDEENLARLMAEAEADTEHHYIITRVTGGPLRVGTAPEEVEVPQ